MKYVNEHLSAEQAEAFVRHAEHGASGSNPEALSPAERLAISDHATACAECRTLIRAAASKCDPYQSEVRVFAGLLDAAREGESSETEDWRDETTMPARTREEQAELRGFEKLGAGFEPESFAPGGTLGRPAARPERGARGAEGAVNGVRGWWQRWQAWQWAGLAAGLAAVVMAVVAAVAWQHPQGPGLDQVGKVAQTGDPAGIADGPLRVSADGKLEGATLLPVDLRNAVLEAIRRGTAPGALLSKLTRGGVEAKPVPINVGPELSPVLPPEFPVGTTVESDQPTLRWRGAVSDAHIEVVVEPSAGDDPIYSGPLAGMQGEWTVPQPLPRGRIYRWHAKIGRVAAGESPTGATFKVLSAEAHARLEALRRGGAGGSHLALGVAYAREGMREAAQEEFRQLQNGNGHSALARQLLASLTGE